MNRGSTAALQYYSAAKRTLINWIVAVLQYYSTTVLQYYSTTVDYRAAKRPLTNLEILAHPDANILDGLEGCVIINASDDHPQRNGQIKGVEGCFISAKRWRTHAMVCNGLQWRAQRDNVTTRGAIMMSSNILVVKLPMWVEAAVALGFS